MLQTLALTAVLSLAPAQDAPLNITNDRVTFCGEFGPNRPNNRYLPGDTFYLAFDMENLKPDAFGVVQYMMGMEVRDATGKSILSKAPAKETMVLPFGGGKLPGRGYVNIDLSTAPGTYTCKMTVTDAKTNQTRTLEKSFEVQPAAFGMVSMFASADDKGEISMPLMGIPGQVMFLHFFVVGFGRDPSTKQPNVVTELRVYDQNGKLTTEQPSSLIHNKDIDDKVTGLPFTFRIPMNRAGSYTVEIKAECKVTGKPYKISFPINVMSPK